MRVCLAKQRTCYDLYTKSGSNPRELVESSNWRSGPIGIWEKWPCDVRILEATDDPECSAGRKMWEKYVKGWDIWPEGQRAENVEDIDWDQYDIVIAIDVAVPSRIIRKYPKVMWCYYFVEGGPLGIDTIFRGSPFYGYNVFLNHRCAKTLLSNESQSINIMLKTKRVVLDFPYYLQSAYSVKKIYGEYVGNQKSGIVLGHHSYPVITPDERQSLAKFGGVRDGYKKISEIHKMEIQSKYFIVHPLSKRVAGLAIVEAISAGCLALSPREKLWGFPELIDEEFDYSSFNQLICILQKFEQDKQCFSAALSAQQEKVDKWFFFNPLFNLEMVFAAFQRSTCSSDRQKVFERISFLKGRCMRLLAAVKKMLKRLLLNLRFSR